MSSDINYLMPEKDESPLGQDLRACLKRGSAVEVMALIKSTDARGVAAMLREAGFRVDQPLVALGRAAVFSSVKLDLNEALTHRVDGFGLHHLRGLQTAVQPASPSLAVPVQAADTALDLDLQDFRGNADAARLFQKTLRFDSIAIDLLGTASPGNRGALQLVAAEALKKDVQGFAFDGIDGKYQVSLGMAELLDLHRDAVQAVATESARAGLAAWSNGVKVKELDSWVPDSVQRVLYGSVSLASAQAVVEAIEGGSVAQHAGQIGTHAFTSLLAAQGLDINAKTVAHVANESGWVMQEPDSKRGQYFGPVVALDHRAFLVKHTRTDVIELAFKQLAEGQQRPKMGDMLRLDFKDGALAINTLDRSGRESVGR